MADVMLAIAPVLALLVLGWVVRGVLSYRRQIKVSQVQAEMQTRLLDKFGSSQEMMEYLGSEAGERFLRSATIERATPYAKILGAIQAGLISALVGLVFVLFRGQLPHSDDSLAVLFIGLVLLALGIGFLLSALAAYTLSRKWGVIDGHGLERPAE